MPSSSYNFQIFDLISNVGISIQPIYHNYFRYNGSWEKLRYGKSSKNKKVIEDNGGGDIHWCRSQNRERTCRQLIMISYKEEISIVSLETEDHF